MRLATLLLGAAAALGACRLPPAGGPVPVAGGPGEVEELAGRWEGRYWSEETGAHGTIAFQLAAGSDTARGQVDMVFAPALRIYGEAAAGYELARRPCTTIDIELVRVEGDTVRGTLAPYWNPACDCRTVSVFQGRIDGSRISGTFVTRAESSSAVLAAGDWEVERGP